MATIYEETMSALLEAKEQSAKKAKKVVAKKANSRRVNESVRRTRRVYEAEGRQGYH